MQTINHLVSALNESDARSALYYLSRYLKQATLFDEYGKDIFEDDERSAPSDVVKSHTLSIIEFIENTEGTSAAEFDDETYLKWASHVEDVEASLQPEASTLEVERALEFFKGITASMTKRQ